MRFLDILSRLEKSLSVTFLYDFPVGVFTVGQPSAETPHAMTCQQPQWGCHWSLGRGDAAELPAREQCAFVHFRSTMGGARNSGGAFSSGSAAPSTTSMLSAPSLPCTFEVRHTQHRSPTGSGLVSDKASRSVRANERFSRVSAHTLVHGAPV